MFIWKCFQTDIYIIFIFQTIFQNIKLQDTYNTYNNFFHTGIKLLKNLNSTFLRDLIDTFNKLFSLHSINLTDSCKMFRCKCRNTFECKLFTGCTDCISDGKDTRVKNTDNISGICLIYHMAGFCHHLLRLKQTHLFITLHMIYFLGSVKFTGTDSHKCDSVSVCLVHVCLDFKYKR